MIDVDELQPDDERYDARVKVLCEYLMHHVKEEEKKIFPQAQKRVSAKRLAALGEVVETRRSEILGEREDGEEKEREGVRGQDMEGIPDMEDMEDKPRKEESVKGQRGG